MNQLGAENHGTEKLEKCLRKQTSRFTGKCRRQQKYRKMQRFTNRSVDYFDKRKSSVLPRFTSYSRKQGLRNHLGYYFFFFQRPHHEFIDHESNQQVSLCMKCVISLWFRNWPSHWLWYWHKRQILALNMYTTRTHRTPRYWEMFNSF